PPPASPQLLTSGYNPAPPMLTSGNNPGTQRSGARALNASPGGNLMLPPAGDEVSGSMALAPSKGSAGQVPIIPANPAERLQQMVLDNKEPSPNVLLVESDEILAIGLQSYLTKENFNVQLARDGFEALERILAFKPQLAVIDIMMLRMDGYDFIR